LLRAALQIVGEVGPDALTHRRVADVAGTPLASTTYWFTSKDELLAAALELAANEDVLRLQALAATVVGEYDPVEAVLDLVMTGVEDAFQGSRASLIAGYALSLEAARRRSWLRELSSRWRDAYSDAVSDVLERAGVFGPRQTAELIIAAADGLVMNQLARGGSSDLRSELRVLADALIKRTV
jgi:DNA-binding transcriptional regulator YbjK